MNDEELIGKALREVDWINLGRTLDSIYRGVPWGNFDKNFIRPNFKKALTASKWMLDNAEELARLFEKLEAEAKEKRKQTSKED